MKKINVLLVAVSATLLCGCSGVLRPAAAPQVYDFGYVAAAVNDTPPPVGRFTLDVRSAPWLDASQIDYRLLYDDAQKRRHYADSRWAAPPAALLALELRRTLGLPAATAGVAAGCRVQVELQEFSHVFDAPQLSRALVQGEATVIDGQRRLLSRWPFAIAVPAPSADAGGGARALATASRELGGRLAVWLADRRAAGSLSGCNSPP